MKLRNKSHFVVPRSRYGVYLRSLRRRLFFFSGYCWNSSRRLLMCWCSSVMVSPAQVVNSSSRRHRFRSFGLWADLFIFGRREWWSIASLRQSGCWRCDNVAFVFSSMRWEQWDVAFLWRCGSLVLADIFFGFEPFGRESGVCVYIQFSNSSSRTPLRLGSSGSASSMRNWGQRTLATCTLLLV